MIITEALLNILVMVGLIPFTGTAGTLDVSAHIIVSQVIQGGRVELFFRNTTAGALTVNYMLLFEPM